MTEAPRSTCRVRRARRCAPPAAGRALIAIIAAGCGRISFDPSGGPGLCTPSCVTEISLGRHFACLIKSDHSVWCSGEDGVGELGNGGLSAEPVTQLAAVVDANGFAITDAIAIGAGREHACAVRADTTVWCWGLNMFGQLGNGATLPAGPSPVAVQVMKAGGPLTGVVSVVGSYQHTCALDNAKTVWCWGANVNGELGDGTMVNRSVAAQVLVMAGGPAFSGASELQAGSSQTCVRNGGDIWCWGGNRNGQFGDNTTTSHPSPIKVATTSSFAVGSYTSCFLNADTTISCMGWGSHARLGNGQGASYSGVDSHTPTPVLQMPSGAPFMGAKQVIAAAFGCAKMEDGSMQCWGDDQHGQTATGAGALVPTPVLDGHGEPLMGIESVSAHFAHACARMSCGGLVCWGRGVDGEFGDGVRQNRAFPTFLQASCP